MPQVQSKNPILGRLIADALVGALSVVPGAALLVTPKVHLFTVGPPTLTPDAVPTDFTEATFVGYAPAALVLPLLGTINVADNIIGGHNDVDFLGGAVVSPGEMIVGYWIDEANAGGSDLYLAEIFEDPIPIAVAGDYISLDVIFPQTMEFSF